MAQRSDADLIAAVLGGDPDMYAPLVKRYHDTYLRFATRVLGSADDADDALQMAFVRAYRALARCKEPARFAAWLFQIVVNECRTVGARRTRRERHLVRDEHAFDAAPSPDAFADSDGLDVETIQRALDGLDTGQREAFVLKHVEQLSYDEMVELTGVGESALKMRVKRACARLREILKEVPHEK